jgi:hypothetical protein
LDELALLHNSGLLRLDVAHYMFGYYVINSAKSSDLWAGIFRKDSESGRDYWSAFFELARRMEQLEKHAQARVKKLRF